MELLALKQRFGIIGNSSGLNNALSIATRVAPTNLSVLILGESGVGKEVFSQIIHSLSPRKHNKFIAVNCGAIPEGTIDSELFGHEKGSFTGATDKRKGYFEVVDGGTIFLDEIGEMPLGTQARLLRILESGEFIKVGSSQAQKTNVRIVAATNVDLLDAVKSGRFREDLYYRLSTIPVVIPPLRSRKDDIYLLFRKFTVDFAERQKMSSVSLNADAKELLLHYQWPGNIRELKNVAEQISILSEDRIVTAEQLMSFLPKANPPSHRFPAISANSGSGGESFSDREILYKILFEMRQEIHDLKQILLQFVSQGSIPADALPAPDTWKKDYQSGGSSYSTYTPVDSSGNTPIVLRKSGERNFEPQINYSAEAEVVEESLSIADKEKELIKKALQKHKGKRKDAAADLGISERTLYRKIKEYKINE